jgi:hypothetical protein
MGELLIAKGVLTAEQVKDILAAQKAGDPRKFGEIAVAKGLMEDGALNRFIDLLSQHHELDS